ncbi:hypothetical protein Fmac_025412 [Flemingia macrophylla]|uniref:Uncharacterized protein n=1 Tax=Flemingia macrophylla TaxID=520843 RepID=A0ABD1LS75_9FABA
MYSHWLNQIERPLEDSLMPLLQSTPLYTHVSRTLLQIKERWDFCVFFRLTRPDDIGLGVVDKVSGGAANVEGDGSELGDGSTLEVEGDLEEGAEIELGTMVAHLHYAHVGFALEEELRLSATKDKP